MKGRRLLVLSAALLVAAGRSAAQTPGVLDLEPITFTAPDGATVQGEAGTFTVPENRQRSDSRVITLALLRLPATTADPGPPIFYLAGGPGGSGIDRIRGGLLPVAQQLRTFGDVIALDQRGAGASRPSLACPRRDRLRIPPHAPFDRDDVLAQLEEKSAHCAQVLRQRGIDLDGYDTAESADDLDDLRRALGAEQVVLWGTSYGTHLAMATIRRHEAHVSKAILHGPEGPDHTLKLPLNGDRTLKALAARIRSDPVVGSALPDAVGTLRSLIAALDSEPRTVDLGAGTGPPRRVTVGGQDLAFVFALEIGDDDFFQLAPRLLVSIERGDDALLGLVGAALREPIPLDGMSFAMDCASGVSRKRARKIARQERASILGPLLNTFFPEVCSAWGVAELGDDFRSRLRSGVRTLFISGTLDGRTPARNVRDLRRGLRNSEWLVLEGASHDRVTAPDSRVTDVILDFLADRPLTTHRISYLPIDFEPVDGSR